jgi:hypothetical protein
MKTNIASLLPLVLLCTQCGPHPQVNTFTVEPPLICPGQEVQVQWDVRGRASLRAEPAAADWDGGAVLSQGKRTVHPTTTTSFTVTALDANPADGNSFATKPVQVPRPAEDRAAHATCDPGSRKCTGSLTIDSAPGVDVRRLSAPTLVQSGRSLPIEVCVTHDGLARTCIGPGATTDVHVTAGGTWTLEATFDPSAAPTPPPQLRVHFDFGCP